jgi:hypothetical protein
MRRVQSGVSILFVVVVLMVIAGAALAFLALTRTSGGVDRSAETTGHLARVAAALEQFASTSERLPCPANPALDTGDAAPNAPDAACTFANGTVPWRTIGLRREDAIDAWGFKISYRVYSGPTGLTQPGGASMVHCDTVEPAPAGATAAGLCKATHDTIEAEFLAGKGLQLNDFGTAISDAAFVLISHGPSGLGAYTAAGVAKAPAPASADEAANLAAGPFVAKAAATAVSAESAAHFDDVLAYRRLADFVKRANLAARDWPEPAAYADVTLDSPTISAATGNPAVYGNLGQSTINFQNAAVTTFNAGGNANVSFDSVNGVEGIGTVGAGNGFSSAAGEGVRIDVAQKSRQFAVTLNHFGRQTGIPGAPVERFELRFFDGATLVATLTKNGCRPDGNLASFSIDAGADFDRIELRALPTTDATVSEFYLAQFRTCAAGVACQTSMSTLSPNNKCA